ncbi:helix-turn-helix transcriptional regulator [Frateuria aurantia]
MGNPTRSRNIRSHTRKEATATLAVRPDERKALLGVLRPIITVIGNVVGENVEVVLHDLTQPENSILSIINGHVSGRQVGDSILSGPDQDKGFVELLRTTEVDTETGHSIISGYQTFTRDGRELQSSTVIFRDHAGTPFASLCVNADLAVVVQAHALLQSLLNVRTDPSPSTTGTAAGVDVLMREIISDAVKRFGKTVGAMNKEEKVHAVEAMMERGLFIVKGGIGRAASALGVTRFTIYNYLDVIKQRNGPASAAKRR